MTSCRQCFTMEVMDSSAQKKYFEIAYRTGSDVWTHLPYHAILMRMLPALGVDAFVLDLGVGRGLLLHKLVHAGYRVIGLDYIPEVVKHGNRDLKLNKMDDRARFVLGDALDIPLADQSFSAVVSVGVLQHMTPENWNQYVSETRRVLKPGGYVMNVSLSKETSRLLGFRPKTSTESSFEKFDVFYYFFTPEEINHLYMSYGFELVEQTVEHFDAKTDPSDTIALIFSLYKLK